MRRITWFCLLMGIGLQVGSFVATSLCCDDVLMYQTHRWALTFVVAAFFAGVGFLVIGLILTAIDFMGNGMNRR